MQAAVSFPEHKNLVNAWVFCTNPLHGAGRGSRLLGAKQHHRRSQTPPQTWGPPTSSCPCKLAAPLSPQIRSWGGEEDVAPPHASGEEGQCFDRSRCVLLIEQPAALTTHGYCNLHEQSASPAPGPGREEHLLSPLSLPRQPPEWESMFGNPSLTFPPCQRPLQFANSNLPASTAPTDCTPHADTRHSIIRDVRKTLSDFLASYKLPAKVKLN